VERRESFTIQHARLVGLKVQQTHGECKLVFEVPAAFVEEVKDLISFVRYNCALAVVIDYDNPPED